MALNFKCHELQEGLKCQKGLRIAKKIKSCQENQEVPRTVKRCQRGATMCQELQEGPWSGFNWSGK